MGGRFLKPSRKSISKKGWETYRATRWLDISTSLYFVTRGRRAIRGSSPFAALSSSCANGNRNFFSVDRKRLPLSIRFSASRIDRAQNCGGRLKERKSPLKLAELRFHKVAIDKDFEARKSFIAAKFSAWLRQMRHRGGARLNLFKTNFAWQRGTRKCHRVDLDRA